MALSDRQYFTLRRLQSLTGLVPVGAFLFEHLLTNSFALKGARAYNAGVDVLRGLPYLYALELLLIALPIALHAALGVWIWWDARFNVRQVPRRQNVLFTLQRLTGLFLVAYIAYHVATTRFAHWFGMDNHDLFALMEHKLQNPAIFAFYVAGVLAAAFHLGNGLWGFALHWGLLTGQRAQRRWTWAGIGVSLALALVGVNSLLAFHPLGLRPLTVLQETRAEPPAPAAPGDAP